MSFNKESQIATVNPEDYIREIKDESFVEDDFILEIEPDDSIEFVESSPDLILLETQPEIEDCLEDKVVLLEEPSSDLIIVIDDIPGAPKGTKLPQIEVVEEDEDKEKSSKDKNDLQQSELKPRGVWDWRGLNPDEFLVWIKERLDAVPKHSGFDTAGLERAKSYLEKLDIEISSAMREDIDGKLDENKIEQIRNQIENGVNKIKDRIKEVKESKKSKKAEEQLEGIVKQSQKIAGVGKVLITVPLLISRIARVCINSVVSAGKDLKLVFDSQVEKYNLNDREQAELLQLLEDFGYPLHPMDRGYKYDEEYSRDSNKNYDWNQNFRG